ncbi:MAG: citrate/2-methylcitrate synthase [Acidimicrobiales bacterium]|uniref:citrate synthase (unknown stereospecificity) n=1 Tax=Candidatus Aeolococcus gillhamiae TaxID=3127015 RepID=A0A2W5Z6W4_9BACT|nr:MAG: citrate synthase [Candidatus Dormibacter sp. RRmetagenome_bin12]
MINNAERRLRLTTAEVAKRLGVKRQSVYAYVSRGLLSPERDRRGSTFDAAQVERLAATSRRAAAAGRVGRGGPTLGFVTGITLIEDGRLFYRGEDAVASSVERSFEEVAGWLWTASWPSTSGDSSWNGGSPESLRLAKFAASVLPDPTMPADRFKVVVAAAATVDPWRHHLGPDSVISTAKTIISTMVDSLPVTGRNARRIQAGGGIAARLWPRLTALVATPARVDMLDSALALVADHELAASTLAARVAAAFGADPYAVVSTGLGAAAGALHGANSAEVVALLDDALRVGPGEAMAQRLRRGGVVAGFGQVLYPDGDPRGRELVRRVSELDLPLRRRAAIDAVLGLAHERGLPPPSVDFGLAALVFGQSMIPGAGEAIFTLGRTAGWIAHAMEEYASRTDFRVRASYVGPR